MSSGPQRHIEEWALRKRPGTKQAEAAERALAADAGADARVDARVDADEVVPHGGTPEPDVGTAPSGG